MTSAAKVSVSGDTRQAETALQSLSLRASAVTAANRQYFSRTRSTLGAVQAAKTGSTSSVPTSGSGSGGSGGAIKV
jgi:uncharacterized membrane protein